MTKVDRPAGPAPVPVRAAPRHHGVTSWFLAEDRKRMNMINCLKIVLLTVVTCCIRSQARLIGVWLWLSVPGFHCAEVPGPRTSDARLESAGAQL